MYSNLFMKIGDGPVNSFFKRFFARIAEPILGSSNTSALFTSGLVKSDVIRLFKKSKKNAQTAGKLLACALALREPFRSQSVSLVGFSLGCQVIKSCLKTLLILDATDVI